MPYLLINDFLQISVQEVSAIHLEDQVFWVHDHS